MSSTAPSFSLRFSAARSSVASKPRNAAIDHLRIVLTALVILHHTAITYGGSGGWYWREQPNASNPLLLFFNALNQSYFMGFFFLLAGYYTPPAFERKGPARFLADRFLRLGVPLLIYFFFLSTFTIALARTHDGHPLLAGWAQMIRLREFGPGPLWFAEALLLLALAYLTLRRLRPNSHLPASQSPDPRLPPKLRHPLDDNPAAPPPVCHLMDDKHHGAGSVRCHPLDDKPAAALPSVRTLAFIALALGLANFLVRLAIPVGHEVLWLQLGYFPCYLWLFFAGCAASRSRLLENIPFHAARPWLVVSALAILTLPAVILLHPFRGAFEGGLNLNALYYAFWDPFAAAGIILGLLWSARAFWSRASPLTAFLARNAFGAFILHPPVVVALSLAFAAAPLPPLAKFALVGALACAGSFLVAAPLRVLPGLRRIL